MSGSDESNEDLVSGRTNRANDTTKIWAERAVDSPLIGSDTPEEFTGAAMFIVEPAGDPQDPDVWENNDFTPSNPTDAIVGTAWSGNSSAITPGHIGGVGVTGNGGTNQGTGVLGRGGGNGVGGIGVMGIGGSQTEPTWDATVPPGVGVVALGGRQTDDGNTLQLLHGAGIVAIGGGSGQPLPAPTDTGSVGVFAVGADADVQTVNIDGVNTTVGPLAPGAGVIGRGGVPNPSGGPVASGVVGLSGGVAVPAVADTGNAGVFGQSDIGPGVKGASKGDRGGVFGADRFAQVQLVPHDLRTTLPAPVPITPTAILVQREGPGLPKAGRGGDLMAVIDNTKQCTLWFCVQGANGGPARWAQVLLGPPFDGRS
jgi:hypothetical protein